MCSLLGRYIVQYIILQWAGIMVYCNGLDHSGSKAFNLF